MRKIVSVAAVCLCAMAARGTEVIIDNHRYVPMAADSAKAHIVMLIDKSGSMAGLVSDTIGGFNAFLKEQQKLDEQVTLSVILFDTTFSYVTRGTDVKKFEGLNTQNYVPSGGTALLDAMAQAIDDAGADLRARGFSGRVIFVTITDGEENSSVKTKRADVFERVQHQQSRYAWDFVYLGANQDAIKEAATFGIPVINAATFSGSGVGVQSVYSTISGGAANSIRCNTSFELDKSAIK